MADDDAIRHGHGYYFTAHLSQVSIYTGSALSLVVERFIQNGSQGPMSFVVHRNVTPEAYEALRHAIEISGAGHTLRRMANTYEGYYLVPDQPGITHRRVCVYSDDAINFVVVHFIERYTRGPVSFLVFRRVTEAGYRTLENAIAVELARHPQQRFFRLNHALDD